MRVRLKVKGHNAAYRRKFLKILDLTLDLVLKMSFFFCKVSFFCHNFALARVFWDVFAHGVLRASYMYGAKSCNCRRRGWGHRLSSICSTKIRRITVQPTSAAITVFNTPELTSNHLNGGRVKTLSADLWSVVMTMWPWCQIALIAREERSRWISICLFLKLRPLHSEMFLH